MYKLFNRALYSILFWLGVIGGLLCYPLSLIASYFVLSKLYLLFDGAKHEVTGLPIWYVSYLAMAIGLACLYHVSNLISYSKSSASGREAILDRAFDSKIRVATISAIGGLLSMCLVLIGMVKSGKLLPFNIWVPFAVGACASYLYAAFSPRVLGRSVSRGETRMRSSGNGEPDSSGGNAEVEQIAEVRKPRLNFSKLHGMRALKQRLLEAANPIVARKKKGDTQDARNGILLFGPPGNGKTGVAEALAGELGLPLLMLDYSKVVSQWVGETPRRLAAGFKQAKSLGPCVLFIDEIDSFAVSRDAGASRSQEADNIVNLLLTELVNIRQFPVVVVAATNRLEKLDAAAIREGRFDFKIEVTAPDEEARIGLLQDAVAKHGTGLLIDPDAVREAAKRWDEFSAKRLIAVGEELPGYAKETGAKEIGFAQLQAILRRVQGRKGRLPESTKGISDLVLREETAVAVQSVANRIRDPLRIERLGGTLPGGVLFHGPAGTGKTAVARALAKETGWAFLLMYSFMILPALGTVVPRHLWPSYAKIYGSLADNAIPFAVGAISFMVGIGYAYMQTTRRWKSDWRDTFDRSVWPFTLTAGLNSSAMLIALAGFVGAGKPFADALIVLAEGADPYMKSIYKRLHDDIRSGSTPEVALSKSPVVSSKYHWLIRLYGKGSGFSDALANISSRVSESVKKQTNAASAFAGFFMKVLVVLFMIWTLATMMGILGGAKTAVH